MPGSSGQNARVDSAAILQIAGTDIGPGILAKFP
jgi:hypothetical protein